MNPEGNFFEVGVSRHAPKENGNGQEANVLTQEVDMEIAEQEIERRARFILENLEHAPNGTVMALEPSNVKRAEQTRTLFVDEIRKLLGERKDIEIVELGEDKVIAEELLVRIKNEPDKKFIISDLRGTWLIGFKEDDENIPAINKWRDKLKGEENLLGKVWAAHKNEISVLVEELKSRGIDIQLEEVNPKEFQTTPEEQVVRFMKWVQAMRKIGETRFPDRSLILEGISHNLRSDYTILALLGEDISVESINRVLGGKFRGPFERSNIIFTENGNVRIKYGELEKEYSSEEFEVVVKNIKEKLNARKREWEG